MLLNFSFQGVGYEISLLTFKTFQSSKIYSLNQLSYFGFDFQTLLLKSRSTTRLNINRHQLSLNEQDHMTHDTLLDHMCSEGRSLYDVVLWDRQAAANTTKFLQFPIILLWSLVRKNWNYYDLFAQNSYSVALSLLQRGTGGTSTNSD
jgi:hypothetical protein